MITAGMTVSSLALLLEAAEYKTQVMLENAKEAETYLSKAAKKEILKLLETY